MFAKVFSQIFDSSIADDRDLRHFFMDMLVLADWDGEVDMTPTAIAARTRWPVTEVLKHLGTLEEPDPQSRTPDHAGARITRLDSHRTWGWKIVNFEHFRQIASNEQRKAGQRERFNRWKQKTSDFANAALTGTNASNAIQIQIQNKKHITHGAKAPVMKFQKPSIEQLKLAMSKASLPESEAQRFFSYYESNGWKVGRNPMKSWPHAVNNWAMNYRTRLQPQTEFKGY